MRNDNYQLITLEFNLQDIQRQNIPTFGGVLAVAYLKMDEIIGRYTPDNLELLHKAFTKLIDALIGFARNNPKAKTKDIVYKLGVSVSDEIDYM